MTSKQQKLRLIGYLTWARDNRNGTKADARNEEVLDLIEDVLYASQEEDLNEQVKAVQKFLKKRKIKTEEPNASDLG